MSSSSSHTHMNTGYIVRGEIFFMEIGDTRQIFQLGYLLGAQFYWYLGYRMKEDGFRLPVSVYRIKKTFSFQFFYRCTEDHVTIWIILAYYSVDAIF